MSPELSPKRMKWSIVVAFVGYLCLSGVLLLASRIEAAAQRTADMFFLSTESGLSQGFVTRIVQDKQGYIWIGTLNGLNRYDGYDIKVYRNKPGEEGSLLSNSVVSINMDTYGNMWVFTTGGIQIYDSQRDQFFEPGGIDLTGGQLAHSEIVLRDNQLLYVQNNTIQHYRIVYESENNVRLVKIRQIKDGEALFESIYALELINGIIWVGQDEKLRLIGPRGELKVLINSKDESIYAIWEEEHNQLICVQTSKGIYFFGQDFVLNRYIPRPGSKHGNGIRGLKEEKDYWIVRGSLLERWDGQKITPTSFEFDVSVTTCMQDRQGNMWLGLDARGVVCIQNGVKKIRQTFELGRPAEKKPLIEADGGFWIFNRSTENRTDGFGLYKKYEKNLSSSPDAAIHCYHMDIDSYGDKWYVNADKQLIRLSSRTGDATEIKLCGVEQFNVVYGVNCLGDGTLFLISLAGDKVFFYNPATQQCIEVEGLAARLKMTTASWNLSSLYVDDSKPSEVWLCSAGGLVGITVDWRAGDYSIVELKLPYFDDGRKQHPRYIFGQRDRYDSNLVWIGTWEGLYKWSLSNNSIAKVGAKSDHFDGPIFCMVQSTPDEFWLGTLDGLIRLNTHLLQHTIFSTTDGLPAGEFNRNTAVLMQGGKIVMGTVNGYITFYPETLSRRLSPEKTVITGVWQGDLPLTLTSIKKYLTIDDLPAQNGSIMVKFSTLDYSHIKSTQYRFRYGKKQSDWFYNGQKNVVSLAGLEAGEYLLEIQASLDGYNWGDSGYLQFKVEKLWWKRTGFIGLVMCLMTLLLGIVMWNRRQQLLQQHNNELLKQKTDYEIQLIKEKERILVNIAHELKTPVTLIIGMSEQLESGKGHNITKALNSIKKQSNDLFSMITQILELGRIKELGGLSVKYQQVDLAVLLPVVLADFRYQAEMKSIDMQLVHYDALPTISTDEGALKSVLGNLLSNAVKFAPDKGKVILEVISTPEAITILVSDNGSGVSDEESEKIFMRYYQSHSSRQSGGTGLGLAYAREVATVLGGRLKLRRGLTGSSPGTTFEFYLPLSQKDQWKSDLEEPSVPVPEMCPVDNGKSLEESQSTRKPIIVAVDDNIEILEYLRLLLSKEYHIVLARDGIEGMEKVIKLVPDLIISDVMMPGMSGFDFCTKIRSDVRTSHIPLILLTAKSDISSVEEGLTCGANLYLPKPFESSVLKQYIANSLQHSEQVKRYFEQCWSPEPSNLQHEAPIGILEQLENDFIREVKELIRLRYKEEDFNVEKLADIMNISTSQLRRKMQALGGGDSISNMIRTYRLQQAQVLLLSHPDLSVAEIAYATGFSDPNYFSTAFSKEFGSSPRRYRDNQRL